MNKYLRRAWAAISFCFFGVGALAFGFVLFPIVALFSRGEKYRKNVAKIIGASWRFFVWLMRAFRLIYVDVRPFRGLQNLGGTIVVANHPSLIDIVILVAYIPNAVCIVKGKLAHNIFVKYVVRGVYIFNDIGVDNILNRVNAALKSGMNYIVFPEGTRTTDVPHKLHRGFAQIAVRSNANILPIQIYMSDKILGKGQKWYDVGDRCVNYNFVVKPIIRPGDFASQTNHATAAVITDATFDALFK